MALAHHYRSMAISGRLQCTQTHGVYYALYTPWQVPPLSLRETELSKLLFYIISIDTGLCREAAMYIFDLIEEQILWLFRY